MVATSRFARSGGQELHASAFKTGQGVHSLAPNVLGGNDWVPGLAFYEQASSHCSPRAKRSRRCSQLISTHPIPGVTPVSGEFQVPIFYFVFILVLLFEQLYLFSCQIGDFTVADFT